MHRKSYHIEIDVNVLARHIDNLNDVQIAMEEMAENRRILVKHDGFLTTMADQLFTQIEQLNEYLSDKSAGDSE